MAKPSSFRNKVAMLTGGSSGIGEATAILFSKRGYAVVILDASDKGNKVAERIRANGGNCSFISCDVTREEMVRRAVGQVQETHKRIDCLLNIAGVVLVKPLEETTWEEYRHTFDVNFGGIFLTCKYVVLIMKRQHQGAIVNVSSVSGHVGQIRHSVYGSSKGAILSFTRALAWELAPHKIRVNSVSPGAVDTPMLRGDFKAEAKRLGISYQGVKAERESEQAFGRLAAATEIAEVVYFLASDSGSFVTGADVLADGGWTAR